LRPLVVGSFATDVFAPKRDRAGEGVRKLDLVMLAITINVNDGPFTAFGQDTALALDGMPETHHGEFRNLECIVHYSANPLLADFTGRGETKSMGEPAGRCVRIPTRRDQANALTRIQEGRLEDRALCRKPLISLRRGRRPPCVATRTAVGALTASRHRRHLTYSGATDTAMQRSPAEPQAAPISAAVAWSRSASGITTMWFLRGNIGFVVPIRREVEI
jgi:hypothetical protein